MKAGEMVRMPCPFYAQDKDKNCRGSMCPMFRFRVPAPNGEQPGEMTKQNELREAYCGVAGR